MTSTKIIAAFIIALLIGVGIGYIAKPTPAPVAPGLAGEIPIGALLPLTGGLASYGENSKVAIEIAVEEVNEFLEKLGSPARIKLLVEDTGTDPDIALEKLMSLAAKGVKIVIGPQSSGEVRNLKSYADANKILLISQSSTAPALAIPDDYVYRFCPDDTIQGPAIAKVMWNDGIKYIVPIWRGDEWGDGLVEAAAKAFKELGGVVDEGIRYARDAKEFSSEVKVLAQKVQALVDRYGKDKVAVYYVAFGEAVTLFTQARDYDILWEVKWYGSDGTAKLDELIKEPLAAEFAMKTEFINPIFAATKSEKYKSLVAKLEERLGRSPDTYAIAAYDEVWVVALALLAVGEYDAEKVKKVLPDVAKAYFGASGWIVLNEAGDRAFADYELWKIVKEDDEYIWKLAGVYEYATGAVRYF